MRSISKQDSAFLKAATAAAYTALGGVSRTAELLGVASSTLTKYASTGAEWAESFIRLDLAVELDRRTSHPFLLSAIQQLLSDAPATDGWALTASAVLRLDGVLDDVVREVARAIEDGHVDAAERLAVRNRIAAAQRNLALLDATIVRSGQ